MSTLALTALGTSAPTFPRHGAIRQHDTKLSVREDRVDEAAMRIVLRGMLARLASRGWSAERDPYYIERFPILADDHWYGRKGELQMVASVNGRMCEIEFFQEVERGPNANPNGGRYDFDKFARMPRRIQFAFCVEMAAVLYKLRTYGYVSATPVVAKSLPQEIMLRAAGTNPADDPLAHFNDRWGADRFERDATGWPVTREYDRCGHNRDRDRLPVRNGEVRYFRAHDGYLRRGVVFTNMNEMWMVVHGAGVHWVSSRELFFCDRPDLEPRRVVRGQQERLERELQRAVKAKKSKRIIALAHALERNGWTNREGRT